MKTKHIRYEIRYGKLHCCKEQRHSDFPYSERHLQCLWYDPRWRPSKLHDCNGIPVNVINPGTWNLEAGPDFLDATIEIGHTRICGDVEIHINESDWFTHGHNNDPRYKGVVMLVSYLPCVQRTVSKLPNNIIRISLAQTLTEYQDFSFDCIDITAYPHVPIRQRIPPCAQELAKWQTNKRLALLKSAGEERLKIKTLRIKQAIQKKTREQVFYEEVMSALGYKHNSGAFRLLANRVTFETLRNEANGNVLRAYALLLGVAGLLPVEVSTVLPLENRTFIRCLWDEWWRLQSVWQKHVLPSSTWRFSGVRPANHPVRRLAAASCLFARRTDPIQILTNIDTTNPLQWKRNVVAFLSKTDTLSYWKYHLTFFDRKTRKPCSLLGSQRISAIITNVLIPFLSASAVDVSQLVNYLSPAEENIIVRRTAYSLFGHECLPEFYSDGLVQQGLIQIFYDFCLTEKANCCLCSFPSELRRINSRS